jgi:GntR family transcriptional regulator
MTLERETRSLQAQIKQILREEITAGLWPPGAKVPPEPELMRRFGVSRITVSQALRDLAAEGLLVRRQGKGTFVSSHPQGWTNLGALLQKMPLQRGDHLEHSLNQIQCAAPPADVALDLQLAPDEHVWTFTRVKQIGGASGQWEQAHIPAAWVANAPDPGEDWGRYYFIEILERLTGQEARHCRAFLQAITLGPEVAAAIGEVPGKPAIEVNRLWRNELGQPVLLTRSILRPDGTRYYVDLPDLPPKGRADQP